jgi:hypothetical protein
VSDAELKALYAATHYALAPFTYGTGSKLKLVEACGHGIPVITTRAGITDLPTLPPLVHVTDEPEEWKRIAQNRGLSRPHLGTKLARIAETASIAQI